MKKWMIAFMLSLMLITPQVIVHSAPKPTQDSMQLRIEDMLMLFLAANIYEVVGDYYYPRILKLKPEIKPWHITVIDSQRVNGFRGFIFLITIEVEPSLGHGVLVGRDRITYRISVGPSAQLVSHTHLATYELPAELQEWVQ